MGVYFIRKKLDETARQELADYLVNIDWQCEYDSTSKIYTYNIKELLDKFLQQTVLKNS